jgi:hypothetical protein
MMLLNPELSQGGDRPEGATARPAAPRYIEMARANEAWELLQAPGDRQRPEEGV